MFIILNSNFEIVEIKDNTFVANSSGYENKIKIAFKENTFIDPANIKGAEITFRRADDNIIGTVQMSKYLLPISGIENAYMWVYEITENDGVLFEKGALGISIRFYDGTIVNNALKNKVTQGIAEIIAYVKQNVGQKDIEYYAQYEAQNTAEHQNLQSQITINIRELSDHEARISQNTSNTNLNTSNIEQNSQDASSLDTRVTALEQNPVRPETPIGQLTGSTMPSDTQLTDFVVQQTSRQPLSNDSIIFILQQAGTDKNYKYVYSLSGWNGYEIPPIEEAGNGTMGIVEGTYAVGDTANTLVDIVGGKIKGIYIKLPNSTYVNIYTLNNSLKTSVDNIISGAQIVGKSATAIADQLGNVINTYYLNAVDGATKQYVQDYALPKSFADVYYYVSDGESGLILADTLPITPPSGKQYSKEMTTEAEQKIVSVPRALTYPYTFSKNNTYVSKINVASSLGEIVKFKLVTTAIDGVNTYTLDTAFTDFITLVSGEVSPIEFASNFNGIGNTEINLPAGAIYKQELFIIKDGLFSAPFTTDIYCSATYPSTFNLTTQNISVTVNYVGAPKEIVLIPSRFVLTEANYVATILQTEHQQPVGYKYIIEFYEQISATERERVYFSEQVNTSGTITATASGQPTNNIIMLISSATSSDERGIIELANPSIIPSINYDLTGTIKIIQTETPTALTLPAPLNTGIAYRIFVVNANTSTQNITVNTVVLEPNDGIQFYWAGQWYRATNANVASKIVFTPEAISNGYYIEVDGNGIISAKIR